MWFHGGGWVIGDLDSADPTARELCAGAGVVVASVDYPLAPEHPWPAPTEAAIAVTRWLAEHAAGLGVDGTRVAVGGDSAGGNLAALTAIALRDQGGPDPAFQLLVYPVSDLQLSRYDGQIHAFFGMTGLLDGARRAVAEASAPLTVALSS